MKRYASIAFLLAASASAQTPTLINVEVDYMTDAFHSHQPPQIVLDALVQMYACHGITLNIWVDDAIPEVTPIQCDDLSQNFWTCTGANSFQTLKSTYSDTQNIGGWHYCIIGHQYTQSNGMMDSSGRSDGIDDFIVTLGSGGPTSVGSNYAVAGTFAHELGHDLGLGHASRFSTNPTGPFAPNYGSVMSYQYQLLGVKDQLQDLGLVGEDHLFKTLDYSNGRLPTLIETSLSELSGIGMVPFDWNCKGTIGATPVVRDLDTDGNWCNSLNATSVLEDNDDWIEIRDDTESPAARFGEPARRDYVCASYSENLTEGLPPTLVVEPCISGKMIWVDQSNNLVFAFGTGRFPYRTFRDANDQAPDNSIIYLQPGNYSSAGGPITVSTPMVLTGIGGAVIDP